MIVEAQKHSINWTCLLCSKHFMTEAKVAFEEESPEGVKEANRSNMNSINPFTGLEAP